MFLKIVGFFLVIIMIYVIFDLVKAIKEEDDQDYDDKNF